MLKSLNHAYVVRLTCGFEGADLGEGLAESALALVDLVGEIRDARLQRSACGFIRIVILMTQAVEHLDCLRLCLFEPDVLLVKRARRVAAEIRERGVSDVVVQDEKDRVGIGVCIGRKRAV